MATFTSTLPDDLLAALTDKANQLDLPKNRIIEKALRMYLEYLKRQEFIKSYKRMSVDTDTLMMVEEDMGEYLNQIEE
jgi:predicted transcriptional regulator